MQPADQLSRRHHDCSCGNELRLPLGQNVVVVTVESAPRDLQPISECVQLIERRVTGQVAPVPVMCGHLRVVDDDAHRTEVTREANVGR